MARPRGRAPYWPGVAEGAGAAAMAAAVQERSRLRGRRVAVVLSGGNVDRPLFADVIGADS